MAGRSGDCGAGGKGVEGFMIESLAAVLLALVFVDVCLLAEKGKGLGADKGDNDEEGVLRFKAEGSRREPLRRNERGAAKEEPGVEVREALTAVPVLPVVLRAVRTEEAERGGVCAKPRAGLKGPSLFIVFRQRGREKVMKKMGMRMDEGGRTESAGGWLGSSSCSWCLCCWYRCY